MYEIIYSPIVQEKLAALKLKLIEMCGENAYKEKNLNSDKRYSGTLSLFWMGYPYFVSKMEKEKKLREL